MTPPLSIRGVLWRGALTLFGAAIASCASTHVQTAGAPVAGLHTLVVVPLRNLSSNEQATRVLGERLLTELYHYDALQIVDATGEGAAAKAEGADAVLAASVLEYEYMSASGNGGTTVSRVPAICLRVELLAPKSRAVSWTALVAKDGTDLLNAEQVPIEALAQDVAHDLVAALIRATSAAAATMGAVPPAAPSSPTAAAPSSPTASSSPSHEEASTADTPALDEQDATPPDAITSAGTPGAKL